MRCTVRLLGWAVWVAVCGGTCVGARAQGTKQWTVSRYEEMQRGILDGVRLRSDGAIEAGGRPSLLTTAGSSYVWSVAGAPGGVVYAGLGGSTAGSAAVLRVGSDGKAEKIFSGPELGVQAVRRGTDGAVYAATSPDGKVYRLADTPGAAATPVFDSAVTAEKPRYLWDLAIAPDGTLFVAAGAPATVYRLPRGGKPEVFFRTADQHIRCLLLAPDGTLWAGSDGAGVLYRVDTKAREGKPYAAYAADRREITSLARDQAGRIYAAAVGAKAPSTLQPLPVTGNTGVTVTFVQPGSANAAGTNAVVPDGSEVDRIDTDGTPERMVVWRDDVVYALAAEGDGVVAATGNRGRLYRLDPGVKGRYTQLGRTDASQATALASLGTELMIGTSNAGKVYRLAETPGALSTYTSEIFDAGQVARWGRPEIEGTETAQDVRLSVRTGNVPNPIAAWSDWTEVPGSASTIAPGRYAQWRAELKPGGALRAVTLNYLPRNVAPVVDDVVVVPGARVAQQAAAGASPTVQVVFPGANAAAQAIGVVQEAQQPLSAQKDRTAVTARWSAHDDNGDDLMFAVWYRGTGEQTWRLLKDKISDRFLSFDASLLPDGEYALRVVASDAPVHVEGESRSGERISESFVVDTTPPVPGELHATLVPGVPKRLHATMEAQDAISPIAHAEYAIDAGPWQYLQPVGEISDSRTERYDFTVTLSGEAASRTATGPEEHVLAVRVYDRYENMASSKAVVR